MASYPSDPAGRQQLADELTARGLKPTQKRQHFDRDKIDKMIESMLDGSFDWNKASLQPVILGPNGEIMGGHHRVIAAHLVGIDLTAVPGPRSTAANTTTSEKLSARRAVDRCFAGCLVAAGILRKNRGKLLWGLNHFALSFAEGNQLTRKRKRQSGSIRTSNSIHNLHQ